LDWRPQYSGLDQFAGCIWLARLLDKARRADDLDNKALGDYLFGERDYLDATLLHFLGVTELDVRDVVRSEPNDEIAADIVITKSGKTPDDCAEFNKEFARRYGLLLAMLEADERRDPLSLKSKIIKTAYNLVIFPIAKIMYRSQRTRES
jgi:hypothetical protein